jgi:hypothetical protein
MSEPLTFKSFEEFWPYYVEVHSNKWNRYMHVAGTSLGVACAAFGIVTRRRLPVLLAPVIGYGSAWVGHFFIQRNRPATFQHPVWSLMGDFKMCQMTYAGTMAAEVDRVMAAKGQAANAPESTSRPTANGTHAS